LRRCVDAVGDTHTPLPGKTFGRLGNGSRTDKGGGGWVHPFPCAQRCNTSRRALRRPDVEHIHWVTKASDVAASDVGGHKNSLCRPLNLESQVWKFALGLG
jgi:hypothetical protein